MVLGSTLPTIDPQLRGIIRRINFWKRFFRTFPGYKEEFLKAVASSGLSKYTPCGSFRVSLQDIGWHCLPDGWIRHVKGISLQWTEQSRKYCNKVMSRAWTYHVMEKVSHRKGVDMATYDFSFMNKVLQTKTAQEQAILRSYFAGIHFTFDVISKFSETASVNCPHCDAPDSREHRLVFAKLWRNTGRHLMLHFSGWPINRELPRIMVCTLIMIIGSKLKQANKEIGFHLPSLLVMTKHFLFSRMVPLIPNSSGSTRPQVVLWLSWILSWVSNV